MVGDKARLLEHVRAMPDALAVRYHPGELIYQARAFAAGVHLVETGLIMLGVYSQGESRPIGLCSAGDLLGVEAWHGNGTPQHRGFARALTEAEVLFAPTGSWNEALADDNLRSIVLSQLAQAVLDWQTMALRHNEPEHALAWVLLRWGIEQEGTHLLPVSLTLLADLLAVSRHTVRQALNQLEQREIAELQDGAVVGDTSRLKAFLEQELIASPG